MAATNAETNSTSAPRLGVLLLIAITLVWGLNWPILKYGLNALPPLTFRALMVPAGGVLLLVVARMVGQRLSVPVEVWGTFALSTLLNVAIWHPLSAMGIALMTTGRAAVLAFTMPLWAAVFAHLFFGERLTPRRVLALALGMAGIAALLSDNFAGVLADPRGPLLMALGAISWAAGTVVQKRIVWPTPVLALTGWQLLVGGIPVVVAAFAFESPARESFTPEVIAVVVYNIVGPIGFCYYAWYKIVSLFPATVATLSMLMIPVIGVISGAVTLGEPLGWSEVSALILVCAAIALVASGPARRSAA